MNIIVWFSTESMADYIIDHTDLRKHRCEKRKLLESDASKPAEFHTVPDHIKKILYLDSPDIIVEVNSNPIFTIEESKEAGTGHNVFQRFSRLAAAAENGIPSFYIYPEAVMISRSNAAAKWDAINPLVFFALERLMSVFKTPSLLFFYPSYYPQAGMVKNKGLRLLDGDKKYLSCPAVDKEMESLFHCIDFLVGQVNMGGVAAISDLMGRDPFRSKRERQLKYFFDQSKEKTCEEMSPLTSTEEVSTDVVANFIKKQAKVTDVGMLLSSREKTIIYKVNASFRGDPYPGALAAIDYMRCRSGKTFEDRNCNLVMAWGSLKTGMNGIELSGKASVNDFCNRVQNMERHNLLSKSYQEVRRTGLIPRYYMQTRYGSMFSKAKDIRVYSYFCDAILFKDGALWREG